MRVSRKVKVLIVDDSLVFRETLARGIAMDKGIEVVATAADAYDARDKIIQFAPDVMTLDVEMPKMNGIAFLQKLMPQYPLPVVVISAVRQNIMDALKAGAVDFVTKPDMTNVKGLENLIYELIVKIKIAAVANVSHWKQEQGASIIEGNKPMDAADTIIAMGSSTGGTEAVYQILKAFPRQMPGILIVQHMPAGFTRMYAERLNHSCQLEVREAKHGDRLYPGLVLIAPGDHHMRLKKTGSQYFVECTTGEKVNGHCPSVDVLFDSIAKVNPLSVIGVILTGMGYDGAKGLLRLRRQGARTIGQNEESCVVYGMPKVAYDIGAVEVQAALEDIPRLLYNFVK